MLYVKDFIKKYAEERGISRSQAEIEVKAFFFFFISILKDLKKEEGIVFRGLFSIKKVLKKGRTGNCAGRAYVTEDKMSLKLKVSSELEQELND